MSTPEMENWASDKGKGFDLSIVYKKPAWSGKSCTSRIVSKLLQDSFPNEPDQADELKH